MKRLTTALLILVLTACSSPIPSSLSLTPSSPEHRAHRNTFSSYVYVSLITGGTHNKLNAYPYGSNTSTPTYSVNYPQLASLSSVATDSSGNVYVTPVTSGGNNVDEWNSTLSTKENTISVSHAYYVTTDPSNNVWVLRYASGSYGSPEVVEYNSSGVKQQDFALPSPCVYNTIALDGAGTLYLSCSDAYESGHVYKWNGSSWVSLFTLSAADGTIAAASTSGTLYLTTDVITPSQGTCSVVTYGLSGGSWSQTASQVIEYFPGCDLTNLTIDSSGILYATDSYCNSYYYGCVYEYDPASANNPPWYKITGGYTQAAAAH